MGKGGGNVTQEFKPPAFTKDAWSSYLSNAQNLAQQPLTPYGGQTVSPLTPMTGTGLQMLSDYTTGATPERQASGQAIVGAATGAARNPYIGNNPYLSKMIGDSNAAIADKYRTGTASQNDAMMARAGAYGGSEWQDRTSRNERDLAGALATNSNNLLGQNYNQSANLYDAGLNRSVQAAQVGLGQQAQDQSAIQAMIAGGQIPEQNYQKLLDANRDIYNQNQQSPFTLSDYLQSALSAASGTGGSKTMTGAGGGMSNIANAAGLGGLLYGILG